MRSLSGFVFDWQCKFHCGLHMQYRGIEYRRIYVIRVKQHANFRTPEDNAFAALRLEPWRLRVFPGSVLMGQGGEILTWSE